MALQHWLSRGRRAMLTNFFPKNSTKFQDVSKMKLSVRTQIMNIENMNTFSSVYLKVSSNSYTKWQYLKMLSSNYSKFRENTEFFNANIQVDDTSDKEGGGYSENYRNAINREKIDSQLEDVFCNRKEMSSLEWKDTYELMSLVAPAVNAKTCDAITMKRCLRHKNYNLATSYMEHLRQQGREPNLSTLGNYLQLCGEHVAQCGEHQVLKIYHRLMSQVKILDIRLARNVILALTATQEWRVALDHLSHVRKFSNVCPTLHSAIITAAFRMGDYKLGWQYLETMNQEEQVPLDSVFLEWIRQCGTQESREDREAMALTILQKLENYEVYPSVAVVKAMTHFFRDNLGWSAHYMKIPKSGVCPACTHQLHTKGVSEEQLRHLQEEFVPRVLLRSDIFRSTSPEEWSDFQKFIEESKPFSVVVDGLNAAYILSSTSAITRQKSVREVVEQALVQHPRGRILVLGRQHMQKWSSRLQQNHPRVIVYTLNNMSKDDGFFLYAAMQSGLGTKFLTSDLLRDHLFLLSKGPVRDTFRRWQRTHQVMAYSSGGCVRLLSPAKFSTVVQASPCGWHVPYDDGAPRQNYEVPRTWLCLHPSLTMGSPLPVMVSREPFTHNWTSRKLSGPPHVLPKDNQIDRVKYKTLIMSQRKQQQNSIPKSVFDVSSNSPPLSRFSPKIRNDGSVGRKAKSISEINFKTLFDQGKDSS